jgi:hypothetical protein
MYTDLQAALLCACALLAAGSLVSGQLTIVRNTDDCIYPPIALNGFNMYPNTSYMIQGNRLGRPGDGSMQVCCSDDLKKCKSVFAKIRGCV